MSRKASGFQAWLVQRISAVYLAAFFVYLLIHFIICPPQDYSAWIGWLSNPLVYVGLSLFFLSLLMHAWIGVRDVIIDYIHPITIRLSVLTVVAGLLIGSGFWLLRALLRVAL